MGGGTFDGTAWWNNEPWKEEGKMEEQPLKEGKTKKGGKNSPPTTPRPKKPVGMMPRGLETPYEKAYKDLKFYVENNTIKHELKGEAKDDLQREIRIIEGRLKG